MQNKKRKTIIYVVGLICLTAYLLWFFLTPHYLVFSPKMATASRVMEEAISIVREHCERAGIEIDSAADPGRTGLIGPAYAALTTTKGNLTAKRTTTNPAMAGLVVYLLEKAGVKKGDTIAIGSSASFPGLFIASLTAAKVLEVEPVFMFSLGASSYGATNPDFNLLDIFLLLRKEGIFPYEPAAVSLGGEGDMGKEFKPAVREKLIEQIRQAGFPFIYETDFRKNVLKRMAIYRKKAPGGKISAFINSGGGEANIGLSSQVLKVKPGLNDTLPPAPENERGVLFEMASENIPCIHLLFIKGLVQKYKLPYDLINIEE